MDSIRDINAVFSLGNLVDLRELLRHFGSSRQWNFDVIRSLQPISMIQSSLVHSHNSSKFTYKISFGFH